MDLWDWFVQKFDADPAGWISLFVLTVSLIAASFFGKRFVRWARGVPGRYRARMTQKYGQQSRDVVKNTMAVSYIEASGPAGSFTDTSGRRRGGTIDYRLKNFGPTDATDVRVELDSLELEALTPLYWARIRTDSWAMFKVHIPFNADHKATIRWKQGAEQCSRELELPFGKSTIF